MGRNARNSSESKGPKSGWDHTRIGIST
jgi:hypothetical protein